MQTLLRRINSGLNVAQTVSRGEVLKINTPPTSWRSMFDSKNIPHAEILELEAWGIDQLYDLSCEDFSHADEKMLGGMVLSIAQIGFGALALTTGNPLLAAKLISGGIQDSYKTIKSEGHFKWNDYFVDKGIGIAVDLLTMGAEKMVSAAKTIGTATTSQLAKDAILSGAREATSAQIIRGAVVNAVTHIALNEVVQNVSQAIIKQNETQIFGDIEAKLLHLLNTSPTKEHLNSILATGTILRREDYLSELNNAIQALVIEKRHLLGKIATGVVNGLTTSTNTTLSTVATGLKFAKVGNDALKIKELQDEFVAEVARVIESTYKNLPDMPAILCKEMGPFVPPRKYGLDLLQCFTEVGMWNGKEFDHDKLVVGPQPPPQTTTNSQGQQITAFQLQELPKAELIDYGPIYNPLKKRLLFIINNIDKAIRKDYTQVREGLAKEYAGYLNENLRSRVTNQILMPVSSGVVNYIAKSIQNQLLRDISSEINIEKGNKADTTRNSMLKNKPDSADNTEQIKNAKLAENSLSDIEKQLSEDYPGLSNIECKMKAQEIYELELKWRSDPSSRAATQFASNSFFASDVPLFNIPYARTHAISQVMHSDAAKESEQNQLAIVKNTIKTGLIKSDEAIGWVGEKLNGLESSFAGKYPIVYFGYKGANAYMSIQPDMVSKIMIDVGDYIAHKNDQYIVNPALNYIGIQQGQPGYTTGKIIIDSTIAGLIGKGLTKAFISSSYVPRPIVLIKPTTVTLTINSQVRPDMGAYKLTKGHHIYSKKAFEGHVKYDAKEGFCISNEFMKEKGWKHEKMTTAQHVNYKELDKSGRPNTLQEHTRVAVKALEAGGASSQEARNIVSQALQQLRKSGATEPINIPWSKK